MREYKTTETRILTRMICNSCGKVIALRGGVPMEGVCACLLYTSCGLDVMS